MDGTCPKCEKEKKLTEHHYLPRRFFGKKKGKTIRLCFDCHTELEKYIPKTEKMPVIFYYLIVRVFLNFKEMKSAQKKVKKQPKYRHALRPGAKSGLSGGADVRGGKTPAYYALHKGGDTGLADTNRLETWYPLLSNLLTFKYNIMNEKISKFLDGKKTYIGIAITVIGLTNLASYITPGEISTLLDSAFKIFGIGLTVYGRAVTNKE